MRFLISLFLFSCLFSCKDDDNPTLPAATRKGLNTFGCKVNGKVMVWGGYYGALNAEVHESGYAWLSFGNSNTKQVLNMVIDREDQPLEEGVRYAFDDSERARCWYNVYRIESESCMYASAPVSGGITFTEINWEYRIVSGIFDFEVYSDECDKSVSVTEGRFDIMNFY
jgi:hypothetical protein